MNVWGSGMVGLHPAFLLYKHLLYDTQAMGTRPWAPGHGQLWDV